MRKVTVGDLRYRFSRIEHLLRQGEEVQITKRGRLIARLVPEVVHTPVELPDFYARLQAIYGKKMLQVSGAGLIARDRCRY
jgi:antitoxin (DNA-binding transcriptional repressor) of toxin-antitoxin stability system